MLQPCRLSKIAGSKQFLRSLLGRGIQLRVVLCWRGGGELNHAVTTQVFRLKAEGYKLSREARIKPFNTFSVSSPHYSRALLLQSRIRRCDRPGRRSAALGREASFVKREAQDGQSVSVSLHARYEIRPATGSGRPEPVEGRFTRNARSGAFATNRHE